MKRSLQYGITLFTSFVLGVATGAFSKLAIQNSSIQYGVFTIIVLIALILNIVRGFFETSKKK